MSGISIITSMLRAETFIDGLIQNVTEMQRFDDCEWIVIDVNPSEETYEGKRVQQAAEKHFNIKYFQLRFDPRGGVYGVWNLAIKSMAQKEYITNWNCDDRRYKDSFAKQIDILDNEPDVDLLYNDHYWHGVPNTSQENIRQTKHSLMEHPEFSIENICLNNMPHNDPVWRKSLHDKFGVFDTNTITVADWNFWVKCAIGGAVFKKVHDIRGIYYNNPEGISTGQHRLKERKLEVARAKQRHKQTLNNFYQGKTE